MQYKQPTTDRPVKSLMTTDFRRQKMNCLKNFSLKMFSFIIYLTSALAAVVVVSCGVLIFASSCAKSDNKTDITSDVITVSETSKLPPKYILKQTGEIIGLFSPGEDIPERLIDIKVSSLPEADRKLLAKGIEINSDSQLHSILEDLGS